MILLRYTLDRVEQKLLFLNKSLKITVLEFKNEIFEGVKNFALNDKQHNIVTGGLDTIVRVWNTFLPKHPSATLRGHNAAVIFVTFMRKGQRICSISKDKCVKVWNLLGSTCLQVCCIFN